MKNIILKFYYFFPILLYFILCSTLQAQDYSGIYYLANGNGYNAGTPATNFYLVPSTVNYATDQPHLTTYQSGKEANSCWQITKVGNYYRIIHVSDGKYLTANPAYSGTTGNDVRRLRVHLEEMNVPDDNTLFIITANGSGGYNIKHKDISDNIYLDPAGGNINDMSLTNARQMTTSSGKVNVGGGIGYWTDEPAARWYFEDAFAVAITPNAGTKTIILNTTQPGATIYYTLDGTDPDNTSNPYNGTSVNIGEARVTIKAIAYVTINGDLTASPISSMFVDFRDLHEISSVASITLADGIYKLSADIATAGAGTGLAFTGEFDGNGHTINGLTSPLFASVNNATIKNLTLDNVNINTSGKVGAVAGSATGNSRIYNIGILGGTIKSTNNYCGGIVGELDEYSRVINCFNYASVEGTHAGGIVGYNTYASTSDDLRTMVMNCMVYGDVTGSVKVAPVYGGEIISNRYVSATNTGLNNYNYFSFDSVTLTGPGVGDTVFNCALAAESRNLLRFEFYKNILNSNRALAAWYVTGSVSNASIMLKWVHMPDSIGTRHPFPILNADARYPTIVNPDAEHAIAGQPPLTGGVLGTLTVTIQAGSQGSAPYFNNAATITTDELILNITDKDTAHYNFNYRKVQLPYYNDVGTGNYTGNRVVTGWKIVNYTGTATGSFTTTNYDAPNYNFADRTCIEKDLYGTSGRIFSQGAYFDVPDGVTGITIEPYWAYCTYLSDKYYDVTYNFNDNHTYNTPTGITAPGIHYNDNTNYNINGSSQKVYNSFNNARNNCDLNAAHTVYDHAIVLVGNYHSYGFPFNKDETRPYTVMSVDFDNDNEPDNNFYIHFPQRNNVNPIRFDFICVPGIGMAHKVTGSIPMPQIGIFRPKGWFEITNTCIIQFGQFEYDFNGKTLAPLILLGGIFDQFVSTADNTGTEPQPIHTQYIHVGGNAWFKMFNNGVHGDRNYNTPKRPISVTGGYYEEFYLSGMFRPDASIVALSGNDDDLNAECYIDGGRFGVLAGCGMEQINGNVTWKINNADIHNFYGGGINAAKEITGTITTTIINSRVEVFCGGPKFGNMHEDKDVNTHAIDCIFGTYFGAGYGGTSFNRVRTQNEINQTNYDFNGWRVSDYSRQYDAGNSGIATSFEYELISLSGAPSKANVGRFYINYASLSLARTQDVISLLENCTVTGNYYGGGNMGMVLGDVTSTLKDCTVLGDVYGAGFSAAVPTVKVMPNSNYVTEPYYDGNMGIYIQGVPPTNVEYKWEHAESVSAGSEFNEVGGHFILTTVDLNNLGKVDGNTELRLYGSTKVHGNVYGGGNMGEVTGNTRVVINQDR